MALLSWQTMRKSTLLDWCARRQWRQSDACLTAPALLCLVLLLASLFSGRMTAERSAESSAFSDNHVTMRELDVRVHGARWFGAVTYTLHANMLQKAQLSLGWSRPYWLSLTLKVIQGRWVGVYNLKANMRLPIWSIAT